MRSRWPALVVAMCVSARAAQAQTAPPADAPRVFLDCSHFCDESYIKTEMSWIAWVRDQADAGVHILVTRQATGGGGAEWKLNFIGLKDRQGRSDTLQFTTSSNDTEEVVRTGMVRTLKAGLIPYVVHTSLGSRLQISMGAAPASTAAVAKTDDPWNYWVFTVAGRGNVSGESSQQSKYWNANVSANRTTEAYKMRVSMSGNRETSEYTYFTGTRDTTITSQTRSYNFNLLIVKSIGGNWSAGVQSSASSASYRNIDLGTNLSPAIEYSIWPYSEATRRSLAIRYAAGIKTFDYKELTIFQKMEESHPTHSLTAELSLRQKWGNFGISSSASQYLHDTKKYNATIFANANVRLFKGFSIDFFGDYSRVRDQLSIAGGDLTQSEVLLRQSELETNYRYFSGFGVRYSFGSIFNNVVNPRFGENF